MVYLSVAAAMLMVVALVLLVLNHRALRFMPMVPLAATQANPTQEMSGLMLDVWRAVHIGGRPMTAKGIYRTLRAVGVPGRYSVRNVDVIARILCRNHHTMRTAGRTPTGRSRYTV
jgi:hypothetical protein